MHSFNHLQPTRPHEFWRKRRGSAISLKTAILGPDFGQFWTENYSLARTVVKVPKSCHITPIIRSLHWLRITERIEYKLFSLIYKATKFTQLHNLNTFITSSPFTKLTASIFFSAVYRCSRQGITHFCELCSLEAQNRTNRPARVPCPPGCKHYLRDAPT